MLITTMKKQSFNLIVGLGATLATVAALAQAATLDFPLER